MTPSGMDLTTLDHFTLPLTSPNRTLNVTFRSDLDSPHSDHWDLPIKVIFATFLSIFMLCAIVGNLMVLSVIGRHKGMRTRTNMFLGSLATADLCVAILDMPFSLATIIRGTWIFEDEFCVFNGFTMAFFLVTSIHNLMYISVHKYVTITRPFSRVLTYRKILLMIGGAWFWGFLTAMLTVTGLNHVVYKNATTQCGPDFPHTTQQYAHTIFTTSTCWLVPFVVMIFCYRRMFVEIKGYTLRLQAHTNQERDSVLAQQKRITVTLFIVLVVFFICWFPYIVYSTYASIIEDKTSLPHWANPLVYWLGYLHSCCNPIIYVWRNPRAVKHFLYHHKGCCSDADVESFAGTFLHCCCFCFGSYFIITLHVIFTCSNRSKCTKI
ncbi:alpha-2B adrenergic receptor-like [Lingula anatina]|uniref:Alpha-2B adrenergic receptor-like n=1 Tax=Lingula anatina TaxID=7574 RepID=A0A1S3IQJ9_LINAN|nr:alpha-2B adrenergic receptor-like [Lingula anatina]|eukprot:XP_013400495.1 alpha-2B adrenergic receptor-like [Lingula anatina]